MEDRIENMRLIDEDAIVEEYELEYDPFKIEFKEIEVHLEGNLVGHSHIYLVGLYHLLDIDLDYTPVLSDKGDFAG